MQAPPSRPGGLADDCTSHQPPGPPLRLPRILEIPAALLDSLVALGVAGFPTIVLTRSTVGSAVIAAGRVDLLVFSELEQEVEIPGLVSCTDDADCPEGETCGSDLRCR